MQEIKLRDPRCKRSNRSNLCLLTGAWLIKYIFVVQSELWMHYLVQSNFNVNSFHCRALNEETGDSYIFLRGKGLECIIYTVWYMHCNWRCIIYTLYGCDTVQVSVPLSNQYYKVHQELKSWVRVLIRMCSLYNLQWGEAGVCRAGASSGTFTLWGGGGGKAITSATRCNSSSSMIQWYICRRSSWQANLENIIRRIQQVGEDKATTSPLSLPGCQ